jgi:hypothetical protein
MILKEDALVGHVICNHMKPSRRRSMNVNENGIKHRRLIER